jgi:hypothetical protein
MAVGRLGHTGTLLNDGTVLVTGGFDGASQTPVASAEIYDPTTGIFIATGNMGRARYRHVATLLQDGRVLITGDGAEVFDPNTGLFSPTGNMFASHYPWPTATLLPDGTVLVAGGESGGLATAVAEIYDPSSGIFRRLNDMTMAREAHTATLLLNGTVLITGGGDWFVDTLVPVRSAELFDPTAGIFSGVGDMNFEREFHTAVLLGDDTVLIAGGIGSVVPAVFALRTAELYNPGIATFVRTGDMATARCFHTTTTLSDGTALIAGGYNSVLVSQSSAEVFDIASGTFW